LSTKGTVKTKALFNKYNAAQVTTQVLATTLLWG